ncbi:TPA: glycosyltransferase family 1 protein, partial [Candidatus Bathyarchaeota archaeon]|nr:glycosyltransferase family 1 protein [Candidatus Bathyarchaeota archaeon]
MSGVKVGFFTDLFHPHIGGGEAYLINLETRLVKKGVEVVHLTTKLPGTKGFEVYEGIKIFRLPVLTQDFMKGRFIFPFLSLVRSKIFKVVDLIHVTTYPASVTGWLLGRILNKPTVLFCHEFFRDFWRYMRANPLLKKLYPLVEDYIGRCPYDWFICPSKFSKGTMVDAGVPEAKITVAYHGIDSIFNPNVDGRALRERLKLEDKMVFGFTGRLSDFGQKGIPYLLEATKLVVEKLPAAILVLGGSDFEKISPLIERMRLEGRVIYAGPRPFKEVPKFYAMCDIVVGASMAEGFGFMYAEASRCGKAVVATNAGSIPEIIVHGKTGILVPPRDPEALAEAITELLTDKEEAEEMGRRG